MEKIKFCNIEIYNETEIFNKKNVNVSVLKLYLLISLNVL